MEKTALEPSAKPSSGAEQVTGTTSLPTTETTDLKKSPVPVTEMQKSQEAVSTISSHANGAVSHGEEKASSQKITETYQNGAPVASISNGSASKTDSKDVSVASKTGDATQPKDTQASGLDKLSSAQRKPEDEDSYPLISVDSVICVTKSKPCDPQAVVPQSSETKTVTSSEADLSPEVLASVVTTAVVTEAALTLSGTDGLVLNDTRAVCDSRRVEAEVEQQLQRLAAESTKKDQKDTKPHEAAVMNGAVKATVNGELDVSPELDEKTVASTEQTKHDDSATKSHTGDEIVKDVSLPSSKEVQKSPAGAKSDKKVDEVEMGEEPSPLSEEEPPAPSPTPKEVSKQDISATAAKESDGKVLDNQTKPKEQLKTDEKISEPATGPINGSSSHAVSEEVEQDIINNAVVMHKNLVNAEHSLDLSLGRIDAKPVCVESIPLPESATVIDTTSDSKTLTDEKGSLETKSEEKEPLKSDVVDTKTKTDTLLKDEEASKVPKPSDQVSVSLPKADEKALSKDSGKTEVTEKEKLIAEGDSKKDISASVEVKHSEETTKEVKDVPKELKDVPKEIKDVPTEVKDVPKEEKEVAKEVKDVSKEVKDVSKEVKDVAKEVKDVAKEVKDVPKEVKDVPKEVKDVAKEVKDVPKGEKDVSQEVKDVSEDAKGVSVEAKDVPKEVKETPKEEKLSTPKDATDTGDIKSVQKDKDAVLAVSLVSDKDNDLLSDELIMTNEIPSSMTESMIDFDTVHEETEGDDVKIISSPKHVPEKPSVVGTGTESEQKKETSKGAVVSEDKHLASEEPSVHVGTTAQDKPCEKSDTQTSVQIVAESRTEISDISKDKSEKKILDDEKTKSLPSEPQVSQKDDIKKDSVAVKPAVSQSRETKMEEVKKSEIIKKEEITKPSEKSYVNGYAEAVTQKPHDIIEKSCRLSSDLPKTCDVAVGHEPRMIRVAAGNGESEEVDGEQASAEVEVTEDSAGPGGEEGDETGELNGSTTGGSPNGSDDRTESRSSSKISTSKPDTPEGRTPTAASGRQSATKESVKSGSATSRSSIPDAIQYEPPERKKSATSDVSRTVTPSEAKLDGTDKSKEISKEPITEEQETKEPISEQTDSKGTEEKEPNGTDDQKLTGGTSRPVSAEKEVEKETEVSKIDEKSGESVPGKGTEEETKPKIQPKEEEEEKRPKTGDEKAEKESKEMESKTEETLKDEKTEVSETTKEEKAKEPSDGKAEISLEQPPVAEPSTEAKDIEPAKKEDKVEEKSDQAEKPAEPEKDDQKLTGGTSRPVSAEIQSKEEEHAETTKEETEKKDEIAEASKVEEELPDKKDEAATEIETEKEVPVETKDEEITKSKTPEIPPAEVQEPEPSKETAVEPSDKQVELVFTDESKEPPPQEAAVHDETKDTGSAEAEQISSVRELTEETQEEKVPAGSEAEKKSQEEAEVETEAKDESKKPEEESKEIKVALKADEESKEIGESKDAEIAIAIEDEGKKTVEESKEAEVEVKTEEKIEQSEKESKESDADAEAKAEETEESKKTSAEEESKEPEIKTQAEEIKESEEPSKENIEEEKETQPEEEKAEPEETATFKTEDDKSTEKEAAKSEEKEEDELEKDATPEASLDSGVSSDKNVEEEEKEKKEQDAEQKQEAEPSADVEEAGEPSDVEKDIEEEGAEKADESGETTAEQEKPEEEAEAAAPDGGDTQEEAEAAAADGGDTQEEAEEETDEKPAEESEAEKQDDGKDDKEPMAEEPPKSPIKRIKSPDKGGRRGSLPQLRIVPRGSGGWLPHKGIVYIGTLEPLEGVSPLSSQPKPIKTPPSPKKPQKSSSPRKKNGMLSPIKTPKTPGADARKLPPIKAPVGLAPNPNLKNIKSKIGSFDNIKYKPGGGDKKVISMKLDWKATPKIGSLDNATYKPGAGEGKKPRSKERGHSKDAGDAQAGDGQSPMPPTDTESEVEGAMAMSESLIKTEGSEMPSAIAAES